MGEVIDREASSLQLNSMGQGVLSFDVIATNSAPSATLTATATVSCMTLSVELAISTINNYNSSI